MATLYHGTQNAFSHFDPDRRGKGHEPNSALGVWLTFVPYCAMEYANRAVSRRQTNQPEGMVLKVTTTGPLKLAISESRDISIWGIEDFHLRDNLSDHERRQQAAKFANARASLMSLGYDGIWCGECAEGTDMEGACVIFDEAILSITECYRSPQAILALSEQQDDHDDDGIEFCFDHDLSDFMRAA